MYKWDPGETAQQMSFKQPARCHGDNKGKQGVFSPEDAHNLEEKKNVSNNLSTGKIMINVIRKGPGQECNLGP